jgi:adenylate cyclase
VPEEIVTQLARNVVEIRREGQTVYGVCLFADIAGYTPVSEAMTPRALSELMHNYLEATFAPIHQRGGLVVGLKGDSILAVWKGSADDQKLRMRLAQLLWRLLLPCASFNQSNQAVELPTRVSLHAGEIFLGQHRRRRTLRIWRNRRYGDHGITLGRSQQTPWNQHLVSAEVIRDIDGFLARGNWTFSVERQNPTELSPFELICRAGPAPSGKNKLAHFCRGAAGFERRCWDDASEKFRAVG